MRAPEGDVRNATNPFPPLSFTFCFQGTMVKAVTASVKTKNVHKRTKTFNRFGSDMFMRVKVSGATR